MTSLVAGGAGFVGSHLCEHLLWNGESVICIDNLSTGRRSNIERLMEWSTFTFIEHDIVEEMPSLPQVAHIYHLASPASPPAYRRRPIETLRANSEGTIHLLELAMRDGARFLFASTSEVYGDPLEHPQHEEYRGNVSPVGPRSMYDEAKRYGEALTMAYAETHGVEACIGRIFNTYGPRMDPDDGRLVSNFVVRALRGAPLCVYGDGLQTRSLQYVDDLVDGLIRLAKSGERGPINLGNPEEYTVLDLAYLVRELAESDSAIDFTPQSEDDPRRRKPDISRARELLDWEPRVPVRDGLCRTISDYRRVC
jgi:nucleoside-diphosphate-sugar epimerase